MQDKLEKDRRPAVAPNEPGAGAGAVRRVGARMPTRHGDARLYLYEADYEPGEHVALVFGEVAGRDDVLVRIHSECFTGDILGSQRCDCGHQLERALDDIAAEGRGVLLYLRQEGRGIGLVRKLEAYNLQDQGHDTVTANLLLGHGADERDYRVAAEILDDLDVSSVRLLTNNPDKVDGLRTSGMERVVRVAHLPQLTRHNAHYLEAKVNRMRHLFDVQALLADAGVSAGARAHHHDDTRPRPAAGPPTPVGPAGPADDDVEALMSSLELPGRRTDRPFVTMSYAQSLDGSIATATHRALPLSGRESLVLTHALRAAHDAILVGIGTVLTDDPRLNVRLADGADPQVVVVDSRLRTPATARIFQSGNRRPWIVTSRSADPERAHLLEERGARVIRLAENAAGHVDLDAMLDSLHCAGIGSVMVEGGARIITSFVRSERVDHLLVTVAPRLVGGLQAVSSLGPGSPMVGPTLHAPRYLRLGDDLIISARPAWSRADRGQ